MTGEGRPRGLRGCGPRVPVIVLSESDMAPCSPPTPPPPRGAVPEPRPQTIPQVSLIFRFQMRTGKIAKDVLFSFSNMFLPFPPTMLERRTVCHIFSKFSPY